MVKEKIEYFDYLIAAQFVLSLLAFIFFKFNFRTLVVYFSFIIFFSYWMVRIIFNPQYKSQISGN